jgi:O-antigen ligase
MDTGLFICPFGVFPDDAEIEPGLSRYTYFCGESLSMKALFLRDPEALLLNKKEKTLYFLVLIFFITMFIPGITWLYNAFMYVIFFHSLFFNSFAEKWELMKQRKELMIIILFYALNCLSALLSENMKTGIGWVGIRLSLLVFPLAICTIYIRGILKDRIIYGFASAIGLAAIGSLFWGIWRFAGTHDWSLMYNDNLSGIINLQSIYFAMLINLAIFGFIYLIIRKSALISLNRLVPLLLILFLVHYLLASRVAIVVLYGSIVIFSAIQIVRRKKIVEGIALALGLLLASFFLVKFFPKTVNRFRELSYTKFDYKSAGKESHFNAPLTPDQWNGANFRIAVWECAWTVIRSHMLFGTGLGDKRSQLNKEYAKRGFIFAFEHNRNTHNNYLDVWMSLGLTGLIIFLTGFFILPGIHAIKDGDWYGLIIIICFAMALFSENYTDRTIGNTMLGFFISFVISYRKPLESGRNH